MSTDQKVPEQAKAETTTVTTSVTGEGSVTAEVVPDGKVIDFIDGKLRNKTPEEYVRQNVEESLVLEYKYPREFMRIEYGIKSGSRRPRVDIAIFHRSDQIDQVGIRMIVETKKPKLRIQEVQVQLKCVATGPVVDALDNSTCAPVVIPRVGEAESGLGERVDAAYEKWARAYDLQSDGADDFEAALRASYEDQSLLATV